MNFLCNCLRFPSHDSLAELKSPSDLELAKGLDLLRCNLIL